MGTIGRDELEARIGALSKEIDKLLNLRRNRHEKGKEDKDADKYMALCRERARLRGMRE